MGMGTAKDFGCGCVVGAVGLIVACVLMVLLGLSWACGIIGMDGTSLPDDVGVNYGVDRPECEKPLEKIWAYGTGDDEAPQVALIPIQGVIAASIEPASVWDDDLSGFEMALASIRAATRDEKICGICLMFDTPGGTVTDSDILADAIARFRASKKGRFVFSMMRSLCCSGGYYVAAGSDYIMAHPTALTGSIGVIMSGINAAGLAQKAGVSSVVIATGTNKALLDPLKPVDPEHVKILQRPIDQDYERFLSIVAAGRKLPLEKIRPLADGRVLSAKDAVDAKLVDALGYAEDAWQKIAELALAKEVRIYRYEERFSWRRLFSSAPLMHLGRALSDGVRSGFEGAPPRTEYRMR